MNDHYYNKFIIEYLYPQYLHYHFRSNIYRLVDTRHPLFRITTYQVLQLLLHTRSNVKTLKLEVLSNVFLNKKNKDSMLNTINKIQKIKISLRKFINICKYKNM